MKHKYISMLIKLLLIFLFLLKIDCSNFFSGNKQTKTNGKSFQKDISEKKKNKKNRKLQTLDENYFFPLKIFLDLNNFNETFPFNNFVKEDEYKITFINAMNKAKYALESFIEIYFNAENPIITDDMFEEWGIEKWNTTYFGNKPIPHQSEVITQEVDTDISSIVKNTLISLNYTFTIFFRFESLEDDFLAYSKIVGIDFYDNPLVGIITLNNNFPESKITSHYLEALMLHEFTHLLGFHQKILVNSEHDWYFTGIIQEEGISENGQEKKIYYLDNKLSPNLFQYVNDYFGCTTDRLLRINLEMNKYNNIHWPSRLLLGDYMTEFNYIEEQVISGLTLHFLEDLPHLRIKKYYTGGLMRFGKHQGCNFFNKPCINEVQKFENDFYYPTSGNFDSTEPSCSSGRLSRTIHILHNYEVEDKIPNIYRYFGENVLYGGLTSTDYCPVSEYDTSNSENLYINSCSKKGTISNEAKSKYGEAISDNSFCVLNNLVKKPESGTEPSPEPFRAGCYNMYCSSRSLTVQVGEDYLVCPRTGGKIISKNYAGYILCPDYNLICSAEEDGKLCNDMFDCIERKIEEKKIYNYDYTIKTTQDSSSYSGNDVEVLQGLEETEKGICPLYCSQCKQDTGCFECRSGYGLFGIDETDENERIKCKDSVQLGTKHYKNTNTNIYYSCADEHCRTCQSKNICTVCETHYKVIEGQCKDKVEHCNQYEESNENLCKICNNDFKLVKEGIDTITETICMLSNDFNSIKDYYYSVGTGDNIYYQKCSTGVENCLKCESSNHCNECINNNDDKEYAIIEGDNEHCQDLKTKKYFKDSDNKYRLCEYGINNCDTCEKDRYNILKCLTCKSPYILVHSDIDECIEENQVLNNNYFTDENENYASCGNNLYHSVENCQTCNDKDTCLTCKSGYQLLNSNLCISNNDLKKNKYIKIGNNDIYRACSEIIKGCEICTDENTCTECNIAFDLDNHNKCIPTALALTKYYLDMANGKYVSCSEAIDNCEECSSETICTKCKSRYELDDTSLCKEIVKQTDIYENESTENNVSNESNESNQSNNNHNGNNNGKDKDYDKIKALATGGIVLGSVGTVAAIIAMIFMILKKNLFTKTTPNVVIDATNSANIANEEPNEVVVQSTRRTIHNEQKNNDDKKEE